MWEKVEAEGVKGCVTERMYVPGGWLVRITFYQVGISSSFVPDPDHEWKIH